jgi:hypothetical protein
MLPTAPPIAPPMARPFSQGGAVSILSASKASPNATAPLPIFLRARFVPMFLRVFENSSSTHQTTITEPPHPTHNKKINHPQHANTAPPSTTPTNPTPEPSHTPHADNLCNSHTPPCTRPNTSSIRERSCNAQPYSPKRPNARHCDCAQTHGYKRGATRTTSNHPTASTRSNNRAGRHYTLSPTHHDPEPTTADPYRSNHAAIQCASFAYASPNDAPPATPHHPANSPI